MGWGSFRSSFFLQSVLFLHLFNEIDGQGIETVMIENSNGFFIKTDPLSQNDKDWTSYAPPISHPPFFTNIYPVLNSPTNVTLVGAAQIKGETVGSFLNCNAYTGACSPMLTYGGQPFGVTGVVDQAVVWQELVFMSSSSSLGRPLQNPALELGYLAMTNLANGEYTRFPSITGMLEFYPCGGSLVGVLHNELQNSAVVFVYDPIDALFQGWFPIVTLNLTQFTSICCFQNNLLIGAIVDDISQVIQIEPQGKRVGPVFPVSTDFLFACTNEEFLLLEPLTKNARIFNGTSFVDDPTFGNMTMNLCTSSGGISLESVGSLGDGAETNYLLLTCIVESDQPGTFFWVLVESANFTENSPKFQWHYIGKVEGDSPIMTVMPNNDIFFVQQARFLNWVDFRILKAPDFMKDETTSVQNLFGTAVTLNCVVANPEYLIVITGELGSNIQILLQTFGQVSNWKSIEHHCFDTFCSGNHVICFSEGWVTAEIGYYDPNINNITWLSSLTWNPPISFAIHFFCKDNIAAIGVFSIVDGYYVQIWQLSDDVSHPQWELVTSVPGKLNCADLEDNQLIMAISTFPGNMKTQWYLMQFNLNSLEIVFINNLTNVMTSDISSLNTIQFGFKNQTFFLGGNFSSYYPTSSLNVIQCQLWTGVCDNTLDAGVSGEVLSLVYLKATRILYVYTAQGGLYFCILSETQQCSMWISSSQIPSVLAPAILIDTLDLQNPVPKGKVSLIVMSVVLGTLVLIFLAIAFFFSRKKAPKYMPLSDGPLGITNEVGTSGFHQDERGRVLGIGKFGRVETFRHPNQGLYAAKYISLDQPDRNKRRIIEELALKEISILDRLHHKNTIRLFEKVISEESIVIYTALYDGNLTTVYKDRSNNWFTQEEVCRTAKQILKALSYVHSLHIVHRDIKSDNILVDVSGTGSQIKRVYLADFGIAELMENSTKLPSERAGTHPYMAPELYKDITDTYDPFMADGAFNLKFQLENLSLIFL
eukprot:TRINITY_DN3155_c0_g1_i1.p1 TRINITY_DN3155_c0_g1~~TRINITY_DN3155_c0_g1_i1.p1  ORF type:complete len:1000 (-),score=261.77 TRINITY_DN3155_c0_g1_i1:104-3073(-)